MENCYTVPIEELRNTIHYDPFTGKLYKKIYGSDGRATTLVEAFTSPAKGYLTGGHLGFKYAAHRLAWVLYYGSWPTQNIDHWNGDRSDNRIRNLRDVSQSENMLNTHPGMYDTLAHREATAIRSEVRKAAKKNPSYNRASGVGLPRTDIPHKAVLRDPICPPRVPSSGVRGVYFNKATRKWMARIKIDKKWIYLGIYSELAAATDARRNAELFYSTPRTLKSTTDAN